MASLSPLPVLSPPSPSPCQSWTTILAAGVSHCYELVPRVGEIWLTSLHFFPGTALLPQSWPPQTCDTWAGFQEWLLARSFSVWGQCRLLALDHRKRLYTCQPESIFTTHAFLWTQWPVGGSLPLSLGVLPHGRSISTTSHPCVRLSRTSYSPLGQAGEEGAPGLVLSSSPRQLSDTQRHIWQELRMWLNSPWSFVWRLWRVTQHR